METIILKLRDSSARVQLSVGTMTCYLCEEDGRHNPTLPHNLITERNTCRIVDTCAVVVCPVLTILGDDEV